MVLIYAVVCRATDAVVLSEACDKDLKGSIGPAFLELLQHLRDQRPLAEGDRQTFVQKEENTTINNAVDDFMSYFLRSCQAAIGETKDWQEAQEGEDSGVGENDDYYFHIFRRNDVYYGCLGDDARLAYQKVNFAFLEQVANEFSKRYWTSRVKNAKPHGMDDTFLPTLRSAMHYHNIHADTLQQDAKVKHLLAKTESMQNLMGRNLNMLLQNQEKYDDLLAKSETLTKDVLVFRKKARFARRRLQVRYYFWSMVGCGVIVVLSYLVLASTCGIVLQRCIVGSGGDNDDKVNNDAGDGGDGAE